MECPFCKIIKKQAEAHIIHESENIIAFLDVDPIMRGMFLLFPRYMKHQLIICQ